jgi:hypothetical protein
MKILGMKFKKRKDEESYDDEEEQCEWYQYDKHNLFISLRLEGGKKYGEIHGYLTVRDMDLKISLYHRSTNDFTGCLEKLINEFLIQKSKIETVAKSIPEETYTLLNVKDVLE